MSKRDQLATRLDQLESAAARRDGDGAVEILHAIGREQGDDVRYAVANAIITNAVERNLRRG